MPPHFSTDGGDGDLRTSVYPSNLAPIAAKLWQRAFQTICNFRFFDAKNFFAAKFSDRKIKFASSSTSFYIQFNLNFMSNSTSILPPDRNQWDNFFLPTVRSWGDMKLPLATVLSRARVTVPCKQSLLPKIIVDFNQSAFLLKKLTKSTPNFERTFTPRG